MDTLVTVGAIIVAIALKLLFFYFYAKNAEKKAPKKSEPFELVQKAPDGAIRKRVLVTGGCGFLGSAIVRQLNERLGKDVSVVVLDVSVTAKFGELLPDVTYYRGDICTYSHVRAAAADCACVVHTAALVVSSVVKDAAMIRVNKQGTRNVVEACLERDVKALVYTSSASVVFSRSLARPSGGGGVKEPISERTEALMPEDLNGAYPLSKAEAERLVLAANSHVLHVVVLRPGGVYGIGEEALAKSILNGQPYIGPGVARVPFVWVEDAARAHVDAVEKLLFPKPDAPRIHGRVYHLCHDPVRDPFRYSEFAGGSLNAESTAHKDAAVKAAEREAGVTDPPPGINAYGRRCNPSWPRAFFGLLAHINYFVGQTMGAVLLHASLTPSNLLYSTNDWPCDVSDARRLLGWEPTPWRVVAARLGMEAVAGTARGGVHGVGKTKTA
ncbi:hypothetical protein VOLCADRAFT_86632 [Volvox carteri f. nagariensis]|uniref:3-beta hydroxysteroid dehydrogenase/isomerase domain-containing protein n=1 Tax=Volvox carteri f. nagariensis TaxID=3068 RepID=D8TJ68_VOLCA|nr:uncharacterized protein VOLCADRAFT_86632 [Volvox carteri f. nagariensis]EFJ52486.1 hypothetical protein VOLCADRAFT_86632 [Volvox carteri f. nagariensis]|eukprot:XP_002946559.1 hypothetical protein VOLCADRAFT_86632 [Volvox carteri f. nagariensis]